MGKINNFKEDRTSMTSWVQIGVAKSGNLWLYRILEKVQEYSGMNRKSFIRNHPIAPIARTWKMGFPGQSEIDYISISPYGCIFNIGSIFNMPIDNLDEYLNQCSLVWVHSHFCEKTQEVLRKFDKIVYMIRDPRDIAISMAKYSFTPYRLKHFPHRETNPKSWLANNLADSLIAWVKHVGAYLKYQEKLKIHVLFYERLLHRFNDEMQLLLDYLGVNLSKEQIDQIAKETSFETMKKNHSNHLRKGQYGEWTEVLTPQQKDLSKQIAGPLLKLLNYPIEEPKPERENKLDFPQLAHPVKIQAVERAISHAQRKNLFIKARRKAKRVIKRSLLGQF